MMFYISENKILKLKQFPTDSMYLIFNLHCSVFITPASLAHTLISNQTVTIGGILLLNRDLESFVIIVTIYSNKQRKLYSDKTAKSIRLPCIKCDQPGYCVRVVWSIN